VISWLLGQGEFTARFQRTQLRLQPGHFLVMCTLALTGPGFRLRFGFGLRACLKNVWVPRARPRPSSFVLGFAGNFQDEDEDETRTEFSDTF
jgi:hypothetical protein